MERYALMKTKDDEFLNSFPTGYRFRPTDEELIWHYLRNKVFNNVMPPNKIKEVNLSKYSPQQLYDLYKEPGEDNMYFFTQRDRKYPNGKRPNRVAGNGYWKASGADKAVGRKDNPIGSNRSLVFYEGKHKRARKTDWLMHEYKLNLENFSTTSGTSDDEMKLSEWVICQVYKKSRKSGKGKAEDSDEVPSMSSTVRVDAISESESVWPSTQIAPNHNVPELPTMPHPDSVYFGSAQMFGDNAQEAASMPQSNPNAIPWASAQLIPGDSGQSNFPMPTMPYSGAMCWTGSQQLPDSFLWPAVAHPFSAYHEGSSSQMLGYDVVPLPDTRPDSLLPNEGHYCQDLVPYQHDLEPNQASVYPVSQRTQMIGMIRECDVPNQNAYGIDFSALNEEEYSDFNFPMPEDSKPPRNGE